MSDPRYSKPHGILARLVDGAIVRTFRIVNKFTPWHKLGPFKWMRALFGVPNLLALRTELRERNLHDTDGDLTQPKSDCPFHSGPNGTRKRTEEGTHNDLDHPAMGCKFSRLGRNMRTFVPLDHEPHLLEPNPLEISKHILQREPGKFIPATGLNLLAGAWIQFQVHDWFGHENEVLTKDDDDSENEKIKIEVPQAGDWPRPTMVVPATKPDPTNWPVDPETGEQFKSPLNSRYPAYRNKNPQWWDGSQIYGDSIKQTLRLRTNSTGTLEPNGKLFLDAQHLLPVGANGFPDTGLNDNWWLGLEILHTLFAKEHNYLCERLHLREPHLIDQEIFETARLINCALMAKIHTVEWTPGIIGHPALPPAMKLNWVGLLGQLLGEKCARTIASWLPNNFLKDLLTGIPLSETDHNGTPFALTEEFNAVYRLHPLIPDDVPIRKCGERTIWQTYPMIKIAFGNARTPFTDGATMLDAVWSFGTTNPGAIMAKNYPDFLRDLRLPIDPTTGRQQVMDLAAVDLIRDRERGVPRFCEFRRQLRMDPPKSFEELAGMFDGKHTALMADGTRQPLPDLVPELKRIYKDNLEAVDAMVGMFLEQPPENFGFSDTAFRIFILMASRRLKCDRFFTEDYTEEFYTRTGLDHIAESGLREVLVRHYPQLDALIPKGQNPFGPWPTPR